jgi:hypothetical protein
MGVCMVSLAMLLWPAAGVAQTDRWLSASESRLHVGETVTVCDSVAGTRFASSSPGQPTFLNLGRPYPDPSLTVVIWGVNRARYRSPPEDLYRDRRVCVTGTIMLYRDHPQIVVEEPTAIRLAAPVEPLQLSRAPGRMRSRIRNGLSARH